MDRATKLNTGKDASITSMKRLEEELRGEVEGLRQQLIRERNLISEQTESPYMSQMSRSIPSIPLITWRKHVR